MPLSKKVTAKPYSCFCIVSFVFWSFPRLWMAKKYTFNSESVNCLSCKVLHALSFNSPMAMHHSFTLSEQLTPFPHIFSVHFTFSMHWTMCLWISAGWTFLVFKNPMTGSTSQVAGFLIYILNDYNDWGETDDTLHTVQYTSPLFCKWELTATLSYTQLAAFYKILATCSA